MPSEQRLAPLRGAPGGCGNDYKCLLFRPYLLKTHDKCISLVNLTRAASAYPVTPRGGLLLRAVVKQFGTTNSLFALEPFENEKRHYHLSQGLFFSFSHLCHLFWIDSSGVFFFFILN